MTTLEQMVDARRQPLVARWTLVSDAHGRTRPQMSWHVDAREAAVTSNDPTVTLAA